MSIKSIFILKNNWRRTKQIQDKIIKILSSRKERLNYIQEIIKDGQESNIPECCITFYIANQIDNIEKSFSYYKFQNKIEVMRNCNFKYKACPNCLLMGSPSPLKVSKKSKNDPDQWYCLAKNCREKTSNVSGICHHCTITYQPPTNNVKLSELSLKDFEILLCYPFKLKNSFIPTDEMFE